MSRRLPLIHATREKPPGPGLVIEEMDLEFSNGEKRTFERIKPRGFGAVIIVAMPDPEHVYLVREYAAGVHEYQLGLPKGRLEANEDPLDGANREMQEEIGFAARQLESIGSLTLAPGYMSHRAEVVMAAGLYESRLPGDEPEELEVLRWRFDQLDQLVQREDVTEGRSIAALFMAREFRQRMFAKDE
jgi:ADP-ribose diphosphatase